MGQRGSVRGPEHLPEAAPKLLKFLARGWFGTGTTLVDQELPVSWRRAKPDSEAKHVNAVEWLIDTQGLPVHAVCSPGVCAGSPFHNHLGHFDPKPKPQACRSQGFKMVLRPAVTRTLNPKPRSPRSSSRMEPYPGHYPGPWRTESGVELPRGKSPLLRLWLLRTDWLIRRR